MNIDSSLSVLQINCLGATMSTGRTTRELHEYLLGAGHRSHIACPTKYDAQDVFAFSNRVMIHWDRLLSRLSGFEGTHSLIPTLRLIRYIKRLRPDIVHLRVLHNYCLNFEKLFSFLAKENIATVITLHDFWYMTGLCCYYTMTGCEKWIEGCHDCPNLSLGGFPLRTDHTADMWKMKKEGLLSIPRLAVTGVSDWTVQEAEKSFLKDARILRRIYNWIDLSVFCPRDASEHRKKLGVEQKKMILGVSSLWVPGDRKGLHVFLSLAKVIPESYQIVLVGNIRCREPLLHNITALGAISDVNELAGIYNAADVFLNLSLEETFGKVSAEAIACGTPVISVDSTANREIVPPGGGFVIKPGDLQAILDALQELFRKEKQEYVTICREFAEQYFNKQDNIRQYVSLYQDLIRFEPAAYENKEVNECMNRVNNYSRGG